MADQLRALIPGDMIAWATLGWRLLVLAAIGVVAWEQVRSDTKIQGKSIARMEIAISAIQTDVALIRIQLAVGESQRSDLVRRINRVEDAVEKQQFNNKGTK